MAMSHHPNPNNEESPQTEQREEELRNWAELNQDILLVIFRMVGTLAVLKSTSVCRSWRKVAKDDFWRRIDMTNNNYGDDCMMLTKMAIDRSEGRLEGFSIKFFCDDRLLQYLSHRTSVLKSLRLISCYSISEAGIIKIVKKQPLLEELEITFGRLSSKVPELVGQKVPNLKHFKWNSVWYHLHALDHEDEETVGNEDAFAIAKTMHQLRSLQLIANRLTNEGLKAILEGCPHLESLDIRRCYNVDMDLDMWARCVRLTTLRLPEDSLDAHEFL